MLRRFRFVKRLVRDLPEQLRLAYCLLRDPTVPLHTKVVFGAALGLVLTPAVNLPDTIPVIGELDVLALTLLALRLFIAACPDDRVAHQEQLILEQRSRYDADVRCGERVACAIARRFRRDAGATAGGALGHTPVEGSESAKLHGVSS